MNLPQEVGWPFGPATLTAEAQQDSIKADLVSALDRDAPLPEAPCQAFISKEARGIITQSTAVQIVPD